MIKIVGVQFYKKDRASGKVYYFGVNNLSIKEGTDLIVNTERGEEIVKAVTDVISKPKKSFAFEVKDIIRIANHNDKKNHELNIKEHFLIYEEVKEYVESTLKEMQVISVKYSLNRDQLLITFVSDGRVDFRELVKKLAARYRVRIELLQVGVRDEAKLIGGIGICGRVICCNSFASDFEAVSINMAKNQSLSLVPSKISGICGRLLCCLRYEDDEYKIMKKGLPRIGQKYETSEGVGKVVQQNVLLRTFKVYVKNVGLVDVDLNGSD